MNGVFIALLQEGEQQTAETGGVLGALERAAEWFIGVEAAGRSLEDVAKPLTAHEEEAEAPA